MSDRASNDEVALTRRRLLAAGGRYVAPAILIAMTLDQTAYAQASCGPSVCPPQLCGPVGCNPDFCTPKDNCGPHRAG